MRSLIRYIVAILFISSSIFLGLKLGNSQAQTPQKEEPNGWVCGDSSGSCDANYNVTCCTWGPGNECTTGGCD